jgi:hypothetical protein
VAYHTHFLSLIFLVVGRRLSVCLSNPIQPWCGAPLQICRRSVGRTARLILEKTWRVCFSFQTPVKPSMITNLLTVKYKNALRSEENICCKRPSHRLACHLPIPLEAAFFSVRSVSLKATNNNDATERQRDLSERRHTQGQINFVINLNIIPKRSLSHHHHHHCYRSRLRRLSVTQTIVASSVD